MDHPYNTRSKKRSRPSSPPPPTPPAEDDFNQIVNHLRQQYPEMNNKQLQELYTRWYLRNSQNTQTTQQSKVLSDNDRYHLSNIYNLIENQHTQTPFHTQYQKKPPYKF